MDQIMDRDMEQGLQGEGQEAAAQETMESQCCSGNRPSNQYLPPKRRAEIHWPYRGKAFVVLF